MAAVLTSGEGNICTLGNSGLDLIGSYVDSTLSNTIKNIGAPIVDDLVTFARQL